VLEYISVCLVAGFCSSRSESEQDALCAAITITENLSNVDNLPRCRALKSDTGQGSGW